jgi:hypothetical protein
MSEGAYIPYAPLNILKAFAENLWIIDGPEIGMRYFGLTLPFPTRMTLVRLPDGKIWIHSPIAWNDQLGAEIDRMGPVGYLVAPNTLHYSYLADWQMRYPQADSYVPPRIDDGNLLPAKYEVLGNEAPGAWGDAFGQCLVSGTLLTEVDFFHRSSRTLLLTDLIENFQPWRVRSLLLRWTMQIFGAADPDGKAPFDMQLSFMRDRPAVRAAVRQMIAWDPERIVLAHGRCYGHDAVTELRRAFRWVL